MANNVIILVIFWCCFIECVYPTINLINFKNDVHKVRCKLHQFGTKLIHHEHKHGDPCEPEAPTTEHNIEGNNVNLLEQQGQYQQSTEPAKTTGGNERYLNGHSYGPRDANPGQFVQSTNNAENNGHIYGPSEINLNQHDGLNDNNYPSPHGHGQQYYDYFEPKRFGHRGPDHFRQRMHHPGQYPGDSSSFGLNLRPFGQFNRVGSNGASGNTVEQNPGLLPQRPVNAFGPFEPFPGVGRSRGESNGAFGSTVEDNPGLPPQRPVDAFGQETNEFVKQNAIPFGQLSGDGSYRVGPVGYEPIPSNGNFGQESNCGLNGSIKTPGAPEPNEKNINQTGSGNYGVNSLTPTPVGKMEPVVEPGLDYNTPNIVQADSFKLVENTGLLGPNQINSNFKHESGNGGIMVQTVKPVIQEQKVNPVATTDQNLGIDNGSFTGNLEPIQLDNFGRDIASNGNLGQNERLFESIPSNGNYGSAAVVDQNVAPSNGEIIPGINNAVNPVESFSDIDTYGLNPKNQRHYKPLLVLNLPPIQPALGDFGPALTNKGIHEQNVQQNSFRPIGGFTYGNFGLGSSNGNYGPISVASQPSNINYESAGEFDHGVKHLQHESVLGSNGGISGLVMAPVVQTINPIGLLPHNSTINANKSGLVPDSNLEPVQQQTTQKSLQATNGTNVVKPVEELSGTIKLNLSFPVENNEHQEVMELNMEIKGTANGTTLENTTVLSSTISSISYGTSSTIEDKDVENNNDTNAYTSSSITSSTTPTYPDDLDIDLRVGSDEAKSAKKTYATVPPGGGKNLFQGNCNNGEVMTSSGCMEPI